MKCLYYTQTNIEKESGVSKKILYQVKAFNFLNNDCELCYKYKDSFSVIKKLYFSNIILDKYNNNFCGKIKNIYRYKKILEYIKKENFNLIYIRYYKDSNPFFINFLKKIKKHNIKIVLEIPTYPYDNELKEKKLLLRMFYFFERKYRLKMKKYVDRIVTFSNDNEIFGIKTIKIDNGIDLNEICMIEDKKNDDEINFIIVAQIAFWHGIDRFILSMAEYYKTHQKERIKFHIVGNGEKDTIELLKKLVMENNLENYVIFYGYKSGKELEKIYNKVNIAVGCLGNHRKGISYIQPLKNREYCAKGLPMIFSEKDPGFLNCEFVYKVSEDDKTFDILKIIEWYKNLKISSKEIRKYSERFIWSKQIKKVMDEINERNI